MPAVTMAEATEKIARADELVEIYAEMFPERTTPTAPLARDIVEHIRHGLLPEETVDLWNVVFPEDRNVWYDEEANAIHYNEEQLRYAQ